MSVATYSGDFGELRVEVEMIDVTTNLPQPDRSWRYTDGAGHEHYWQDGYPTLASVDDETYYCSECEDEHTDSHLECPLCGEHVVPGSVDPGPWRQYEPGMKSYTLNGEPISEAEARALVESMHPSG